MRSFWRCKTSSFSFWWILFLHVFFSSFVLYLTRIVFSKHQQNKKGPSTTFAPKFHLKNPFALFSFWYLWRVLKDRLTRVIEIFTIFSLGKASCLNFLPGQTLPSERKKDIKGSSFESWWSEAIKYKAINYRTIK
jgi:hypothetical protein